MSGALSIGLQLELASGLWTPPNPTRTADSEYRNIAVVGGGTAGYLSAIALKTAFPFLQVTLVESSKIPIISVGEATTPLLPAFLHGRLGLDIQDFFRRVDPTFKLGIRFEWGLPGQHFNYPFDHGPLLESYLYEGHVNAGSFQSLLMDADKSHLLPIESGHAFWPRAFAYHLENTRFVRYLTEQASTLGVRRIDREIVDVKVGEDGETVTSLICAGGEELFFELFIDCSGFRSLLMGQALGSEIVSYSSSLFNDTAIAATTSHDGHPRPYTTATTMDHGWRWTIPLAEADHIGYVFSSGHCTVDQAMEELEGLGNRLTDTRTIRFTSGRRRDFWKGNVIAIGNSAAFVEPLESTALHMVCLQIAMLIDHFPITRNERHNSSLVSRHIANMWDYLRAFLLVHFKLNQQRDTEYWRDCREASDSACADELLSVYSEGGPLSYRNHMVPHPGLFGDYAFDIVLLAQRSQCRLLEPRLSRSQWQELRRRTDPLVEAALPQREALRVLRESPQILGDLAAGSHWMKDPGAITGISSPFLY